MDGDSEDDFRNEDPELDEDDGDDDELDRQLFDAIEEVAEEAATEDAVRKLIREAWAIRLIIKYRTRHLRHQTTMRTKRISLSLQKSSMLLLLQLRSLLPMYL